MGYAATIGFFDGVHTGHRFLLSELCRTARANGLGSAVLTMYEHPESVLSGNPKPLLTTFDERSELLRRTGIDELFLFHFDVIRHQRASEFMAMIHEQYGVELLLMGYDHRFGSDRLTDFADYASIAAGVDIRLVPVAEAPAGAVSSSKIRKAIASGEIEAANEMLGYRYTLSGPVVRGNGIGHTIGFPTANIVPAAGKLLPKPGVYAAEGALVNIGTNPTVGNDHLTIEAYLLDYQGGDLYGQTLNLHLVRRIRDERKFASLEELQAQIRQDLAAFQN